MGGGMNLALLCANIALILTAVAGFTAIGYWRRMACTAADCVRVLTNDLKEANAALAGIQGALANLHQGLASGKLTGEERRRVLEQLPEIAQEVMRLMDQKEREQASAQLAGSLVGSGLRGEDLRAAISAMSPPEDA